MSNIQYTKSDAVARIILDRPDKFNSFIRPMAMSFQASLQDAADDPAIRCIIITGVGRAFSAGQDLQEAIDPEGPELSMIVSEHYNPIIRLIRSIEKPVIAAVNGVAAGAGANIALACDIVIAVKSATFIQAFSKIGLIPDSGGSFTLPRLIGWQRASALMMLGDKVSAEEAVQMGMIYKALSDDTFETEVNDLALRLSQMPTYAIGLTKRALNASLYNNLDTQLKLEDELQTLAGGSADYKEGVDAFLEKRKPVFSGR